MLKTLLQQTFCSVLMLQLQALHTAVTLIYTLVPEKWQHDIMTVTVILANKEQMTNKEQMKLNKPLDTDNEKTPKEDATIITHHDIAVNVFIQ